MQQDGVPLSELLAAAAPRGPAILRSPQASGACLALALHCLMVHDGYRLLDSSGRPLRGSAPPPGWNGVENVWRFVYTRPGAAATFQLQCSLHPSNRRMFVHACELDSNGEPRPDNIQILGVQLPRYVPADDADVSQAASWDGVIAQESALRGMVAEFITEPLWRHADKLPQGDRSSSSSSSWGRLLHDRRAQLAAAAGVAALAAGVLLWRHRAAASRV